MKLECISKEPVQDKHTGKWYMPNEIYEVEDERAKELMLTRNFVPHSVPELVEEDKPVKKTKKDN